MRMSSRPTLPWAHAPVRSEPDWPAGSVAPRAQQGRVPPGRADPSAHAPVSGPNASHSSLSVQPVTGSWLSQAAKPGSLGSDATGTAGPGGGIGAARAGAAASAASSPLTHISHLKTRTRANPASSAPAEVYQTATLWRVEGSV